MSQGPAPRPGQPPGEPGPAGDVRPPRGAPERPAGGAAPPRPPRRPISPRSPLEGRQLWRIGDWGNASDAIGRRWEELGARALRQEVLGRARVGPGGAPYTPTAAVILAEDPALAEAVHRHGKSHADALLVGLADGTTVLEPVDFKWTLETAEPRQVGTEVLEALLAEPPQALREALDRELAAAGAAPGDAPVLEQGIFLAPDHADNRAQLQPRGPLPVELAVLCRVDPKEFFPSLPGWDVAQALARMEGMRLDRLEAAERYRLGAGVLGALRKLKAGIFADELPELDGPAELAELRRARNLRQVGEVIAHLDRALIARAELVDRLKAVERLGFPYARYKAELAARGLGQDPAERRRWERLYAEIMKAVGQAVRREGRALVAQGRGELQALDELAARAPHFTRQARALLEQRVAR